MEDRRVDENVQKALNKIWEEKETDNKLTNDKAEETLLGIAYFTLIVGIAATIICILTMFKDNASREESLAMFFTAVGIMAGALLSWGLLRVLVNISLSLKENNRMLKKYLLG